jgi:hypothetical protein
VGQAKRRHVLRYLAARERAGIIGTGPFDLDEALVRLDRMLAAGCRWALAVAVELARTGQLPKCKACHGYRSLLAYVQASRSVLVKPTPGPCVFCEGTGHNTSASLPWPAWLRRKGRTMVGFHEQSSFAAVGWPHPALAGWTAHLPAFEAAYETSVEYTDEARRPVLVAERRAETRTRSFPRGAHRGHDPWSGVWARNYSARAPAWLLGDKRHAEQRRERAQRSAGKAERARRVGVGYSRELSGSWAADGSELERWHAGVRDQADALGYAVQPREPLSIARYSTPGPARHWAREPEWRQEVHGEWVEPTLGLDVLQRGTVLISVDGATMPVTIADGVMRLDSGQRLMLMPDGSVTAHVRSWHRRLQTLGDRTPSLAVHVAVERARGDG